jgi:hypothetical protein
MLTRRRIVQAALSPDVDPNEVFNPSKATAGLSDPGQTITGHVVPTVTIATPGPSMVSTPDNHTAHVSAATANCISLVALSGIAIVWPFAMSPTATPK